MTATVGTTDLAETASIDPFALVPPEPLELHKPYKPLEPLEPVESLEPGNPRPAAARRESRSGEVHVPGYGWVNWPTELLDAQARYLSFIHHPDRPKMRWLPWFAKKARTERPVCVFCGQEWLCPEGAWASSWLSPLSRIWGRRGGRHRGTPDGPKPSRIPGGARRR